MQPLLWAKSHKLKCRNNNSRPRRMAWRFLHLASVFIHLQCSDSRAWIIRKISDLNWLKQISKSWAVSFGIQSQVLIWQEEVSVFPKHLKSPRISVDAVGSGGDDHSHTSYGCPAPMEGTLRPV